MVTIDVTGQIMKAICCDSIVADSINMLEIKFNFSGEWNGMTKTAQFTQAIDEPQEEADQPTQGKKYKTYNVLVDENGLADVPNEIKAGTVFIGVFGVLGSQRMTTAPLALLVKKSSFVSDGETPIPPTPDLYQQLVMQVINMAGSPVIGENGNWFLDNLDTGVKADWSAEQENAAASAAAAEAAAAQAKAVQESIPPDYAAAVEEMHQKAPGIYVDASGQLVHIPDAVAGPVKALITHIEPKQEGSGDPSPDNVRPISGWDAVSVTNDTSGQTITQAQPETVYGGRLDWTTGLMTVTHKRETISRMSATHTNAGEGFLAASTSVSDMKSDSRNNGLCETMKPVLSHVGATSNCIVFGANNQTLYIAISTELVGTTRDSLNAYLAENPLTVVYPLAEPYTIQLTPQQLSTLKGTNNIWSDAGATAVTYAADTKMYIDRQITAIAAAMLNN